MSLVNSSKVAIKVSYGFGQAGWSRGASSLGA